MRTFAWLTLALSHAPRPAPVAILAHLEAVRAPVLARRSTPCAQADPERYPTLGEMRAFCLDFAGGCSSGGDEYVYSQDWLDQYWTVDEYLLIRLCLEGRLDDLYAEAFEVLAPLLPAGTEPRPAAGTR